MRTPFLETIRAIVPLKLYGRGEERRARWQNLIVEIQNRDTKTARMNLYYTCANTLIFGIENLVIFWLGTRTVMNAQTGSGTILSIGMLFAFISYKAQFTGRISALINYAIQIKMLGLHTERLADIVLSETEPDSENGERPENDLAHLSPSVELKNVSFRYSLHEPWILKDANITIFAGESVAVVGPSGSGKTTMLKIALGLLEPTEGEILYGGVPVCQIGKANFRKKIGTVMQDDALLSGSIADNITFFDTRPNQEWIEACAKLANISDEIIKMPMGYFSLIGDLGSGLSGGQKQRLLLARALYKQPSILALDEATSNLDIDNERVITETLRQMELTRLVIAHRPETIQGAARIVQVSGGKIFDVTAPVHGMLHAA